MSRYVAFLRAINVGGHVVKMDRLRMLFEQLGLKNVETVIASGNVLFDSSAATPAALENRIERQLEKELGYAVATFVRTPSEIEAVTTYEPFPEKASDGCTLSVAFLRSDPGADVADRLHAMKTDTDDLHLHRRELYWLCRGRISDSKVWRPPLEKVVAGPGTMRNLTTVRKLAARLRAT